MSYEVIGSKGVPIYAWTEGVPVEEQAKAQLRNIARLPIVSPHIAVMPDVHLGIGATVGSVVPTVNAIIPAAVGVDIGCGMAAIKTTLKASDLPDTLAPMRSLIEKMVPHGRTNNGGAGDRGSWGGEAGVSQKRAWNSMRHEYETLCAKHPKAKAFNDVNQLGTLGGGNHFIEVCLDKEQNVWIMLHSGSRGVGNRIGSYFIELAKEDMIAAHGQLPPDQDLAYLTEGTEHFADYVRAVGWAQNYAKANRELMLEAVMIAVSRSVGPGKFGVTETAVNCHHNYVQKERHFNMDVWLTRKGAVDASKGTLGIIPGSMGARSFIVRGKGDPTSFHSCSHGAGRKMSRGEAKRQFTVEDHEAATAGIECRKDSGVIDETPGAYKDIESVMHAQRDLVEIVAELRQVLCVKG